MSAVFLGKFWWQIIPLSYMDLFCWVLNTFHFYRTSDRDDFPVIVSVWHLFDGIETCFQTDFGISEQPACVIGRWTSSVWNSGQLLCVGGKETRTDAAENISMSDLVSFALWSDNISESSTYCNELLCPELRWHVRQWHFGDGEIIEQISAVSGELRRCDRYASSTSRMPYP